MPCADNKYHLCSLLLSCTSSVGENTKERHLGGSSWSMNVYLYEGCKMLRQTCLLTECRRWLIVEKLTVHLPCGATYQRLSYLYKNYARQSGSVYKDQQEARINPLLAADMHHLQTCIICRHASPACCNQQS